jgi:hypothetical protein
MKIIFLCGSLEPGRDGVGDYTRRLAGELIRQGHQAAIAAIHDRWVDLPFTGTQDLEGTHLPVQRVPSSWPAKRRLKFLKGWMDQFNPSWISLQFVPFSFQARGLPFDLKYLVAKLGRGRHLHIMFHELWVGMNTESPVKHIWWGWLQRRLIILLLRKLKPAVIHTQTYLYMTQLQRSGFHPLYLPLFSNIPVNRMALEKRRQQGGTVPGKISLVLFATLHAGAPARQFARDIAAFSRRSGRQFLLIIIGRCGPEQETWDAAWRSEGLEVKIMGEQPPENVSEVFCNATAGLSTTPFALAGKSGSVAAMLEHGLPVLCVSYPWTPRGILHLQLQEGITEYPDWDIETYLTDKQPEPVIRQLPEIAQLLTDALLAAELQSTADALLHY